MGQIISSENRERLLDLAKKAVADKSKSVWLSDDEITALPAVLKEERGCFVTLNKGGQLRGCIGYILPVTPLFQAIIENAYNAAYRDPRFPPVSVDEIDQLHFEISVLTVPEELDYHDANDLLDQLKPFEDGVIIKKNFYTATFLPQVWEQLPEKSQFLSHLCQKAGLPSDEWKSGDLKVEIYKAEFFEEV